MFLISLAFSFNILADQVVCSGVVIKGDETIEFTSTEKRLLCGDSKNKAWSKIPSYQAQFFMQSFLQSRAYLSPNFNIENETLLVELGEKKKLKSLEVLPESLIEKTQIEKDLMPVFEGKALNPTLLNEMEASALGLLRENAYACAKVSALTEVKNGHVALEVEGLNRFKFGEIKISDTEGLKTAALKRFYPFSKEDPFDSSLLKLAEKRLVRSGVAQAGYFIEECGDSKLQIEQNFIFGDPRVLRFGVGASTELGPILRIKWSNNRYKDMASQLKAKFQASFKTQSLNLSSNNYLWEQYPRRSIISEFDINREDQTDFEEINVTLKTRPRWEMDTKKRLWSFTAGPAYLNGIYRSDVEQDSNSFSALSFTGGVKSIEHSYEIYDFHPQDGSIFSVNVDYRPEELGFDATITRFSFGYTEIAKLMKLGRGNAIGALRAQSDFGVIANSVDLTELPPSVKYYGGGSTDLRGYPLKSLPENNGVGAITKLLIKTELRKTHLFNPNLEGFVFYDFAKFGVRSWELSERNFQSPGVGIRWLSPIGLTQVYVAQALASRPHEDNGELVYLGLGGEF